LVPLILTTRYEFRHEIVLVRSIFAEFVGSESHVGANGSVPNVLVGKIGENSGKLEGDSSLRARLSMLFLIIAFISLAKSSILPARTNTRISNFVEGRTGENCTLFRGPVVQVTLKSGGACFKRMNPAYLYSERLRPVCCCTT